LPAERKNKKKITSEMKREMKKLLLTVAIVIGMIAATFASENEKEVNIILEDDKLHFNYYSQGEYEGIVVDEASKLVRVTENGARLTLSADDKIVSRKGYNSEFIAVSFDLSECEAELLEEEKVVEMKLMHANGMLNHEL